MTLKIRKKIKNKRILENSYNFFSRTFVHMAERRIGINPIFYSFLFYNYTMINIIYLIKIIADPLKYGDFPKYYLFHISSFYDNKSILISINKYIINNYEKAIKMIFVIPT